jgi:trafficking protein particle complex subunit 2
MARCTFIHTSDARVCRTEGIGEEEEWGSAAWSHISADGVCVSRYLKCIDKFFDNYISCFVTAGNVKFLLLHHPVFPTGTSSSRSSTAIGANPTSPATEEAIKLFFTEVYENWVKATMNPFYSANMEVRSPVFRARVAAAGRKYL